MEKQTESAHKTKRTLRQQSWTLKAHKTTKYQRNHQVNFELFINLNIPQARSKYPKNHHRQQNHQKPVKNRTNPIAPIKLQKTGGKTFHPIYQHLSKFTKFVSIYCELIKFIGWTLEHLEYLWKVRGNFEV